MRGGEVAAPWRSCYGTSKEVGVEKGAVSMTGVILAGGESKRWGVNKAFVEVGGVVLIERVLEVLRGLFEEVFIITVRPEL